MIDDGSRMRRPCEHGRYDSHDDDDGFPIAPCPGGQFCHLSFISLFAGVGGFDLAFERAGMECYGQVEIDTHCRDVLATHWPDVPRWEDIHEVTASNFPVAPGRVDSRQGIRSHTQYGPANRVSAQFGNIRRVLDKRGANHGAGPVDVLVGGFPCQDYSLAGNRGGLAGDRGALWWQFHRLIAECRPEWVVGENVPGLLSSNGGRDFGAIVGSLVELGYGVVWRMLDAQYFGVAQRRRRVFIVGHIGGIPRPEILDFAQGSAWDTPPRRAPGQTTPSVTSKWSKGVGGPSGDETHNLIPETVGALRTRDWKGPPVDVAEPSLVNGARGQGIRRLTPLECERLQGFPDNWTASQSDTQRYRQMGNAVAVPVAEWIGHRLATA